ncbi:hypothetical protein BDU57DRAFT_502795 [Ampelomyces quisqualis]|uniref:Pre-mRNA-splicing factor 38B n=1 Tax=Ampelomyces quisqualis TaxID=50730 RepID=A0A6A5QGN5_AMPQU|nr:hypothetical protein BDU57DRAFT_502795 [Ampelomyces quisqualis]
MGANIDDDNYIAKLLVQDAKTANKKYELVGLDAFNSKRSKSGAPKPNTSFLKNIIRQTDSHNAALLAREAEESNARLKEMNLERLRAQRNKEFKKESKADGRLTPVLCDEEASRSRNSRRRPDDRTSDGTRDSRMKRKDRSLERYGHNRSSKSRNSHREKRKREGSSERPSRRSEHERHRDSRHGYNSEVQDDRSHKKHKPSHRRKRRRSLSRSSSISPTRPHHPNQTERSRKHHDRSRSPRSPPPSEPRKPSSKSRRRSPTPDSDSDPLESIVGPLPPNVQPAIRSRGRGAHKASSMGMDSRFSSTYDPAIDVRPASDAEDDWGEALESLRDRQRWKQQGADRLKAAGFTDAQVMKWEKGDGKDEEDVTWSKRGQAREWDRGKVVDEDGHVELKAEWARLT